MKIDMYENKTPAYRTDNEKTNAYGSGSHDTAARIAEMTAGYSLDISGSVKDNNAYGNDDLKQAEDIMLEASGNNVQLNRNYMAVMSNSLSEEDYAELVKEGGKPGKMKFDEIVTSLDKIKAKLAEGGTVVEGYNDDLSSEDLERITGNSGQALKIENALKENDIPVDYENVASMKDAYEKLSSVSEVSEEMLKYMVKNHLEPTIDNIYIAQFSAGNDSNRQTLGYYMDSVSGYYAKKAEAVDWSQIEPQAVRIVENSNVADKEAAIENAKWVVENGIPLIGETLKSIEKIKAANVNLKDSEAYDAMAAAISDGKTAGDANLYDARSIAKKIVDLTNGLDELINTRKMQEARLYMSIEANSKLARKGISIDTLDIEHVVDFLREAEKDYYRPFLTKDSSSGEMGENALEKDKLLDEKIDIFKNTSRAIDELKSFPAEISVRLANMQENTLKEVFADGARLKEAYEKAGKAYEPLMTEVRSDLGDSIRKAFRNTDDLLKGMGEEQNEVNRRTIRIMAYSGTEITKENFLNVRSADAALRGVIDKMTPLRTLSIIREGINPLKENIYELSDRLNEKDSLSKAEKYSDFLVKLEKSNEITPEERESYIGIYRLFNQLEKNDSRVIGDVLKEGKTLTLENLLSATRSNRSKGMDAKIDDSFGTLSELKEKGKAIDTQIGTAFNGMNSQNQDSNSGGSDNYSDSQSLEKFYKGLAGKIIDSMDPDALKDSGINDSSTIEELYDRIKDFDNRPDRETLAYNLQMVKDAAKVSDNVIETLLNDSSYIDVTIDNLLAEDAFRSMNKNAFRMMDKSNLPEDARHDFESEFARVSEALDSKEEALGTYVEMAEKCKSIIDEAIENDSSYIDVREKMLINKQLSLAAAKAENEEFEIPVKIDDEWNMLHLKLVHDSENSGRVAISVKSEQYGKIDARFELNGNELNGYIVGDESTGLNRLIESRAAFESNLNNSGISTKDVRYLSGKYPKEGIQNRDDAGKAAVSSRGLYKVAKAFISSINTAKS